MCPELTELLSWNGPTVHVCCFMLACASAKTFVSRVQKTAKKSSLAEKFVSRVTRQPRYHCTFEFKFQQRKDYYRLTINVRNSCISFRLTRRNKLIHPCSVFMSNHLYSIKPVPNIITFEQPLDLTVIGSVLHRRATTRAIQQRHRQDFRETQNTRLLDLIEPSE